ncbi:MAG: VCBS repeat-containing protein [Planctomycetota bacterium]
MTATLIPLLLLSVAPPSSLHWADVDADGFLDVLALEEGGRPKLLLNSGRGSFRDGTVEAGLGELVGFDVAAWHDVDGDRSVDLVLGSSDGSSCALLQRDGVFQRVVDPEGLESLTGLRQVTALDVNGDRVPDLHAVGFDGDVVLRGRGDGTFERLRVDFDAPTPDMPSAEDAAPGTGDATTPASGSTRAVPVLPPPADLSTSVFCPPSVQDMATGLCLPASSVPTLGALYPLGNEFFITPAGDVGIGTLSPQRELDVVGTIRARGRLIIGATSGSPMTISSSARVPNLNADLLDGFEASAFSRFGPLVDSAEIANGTIRNADISGTAQIQGTKILPDFGTQAVTTAGSVVSQGNVQAGFGLETNPTFRFSPIEPTGLSSPVGNAVYVLTNAVVAARFLDGGEVVLGSSDDSEIRIRPSNDLVTVGQGSFPNNQKFQVSTDSVPGGLIISAAMRASHTATTGEAFGLSAFTRSASGIGVSGWATSEVGETYGVRGRAEAPLGAAVLGEQRRDSMPLRCSGSLATGPGDGVLGVTSVPFRIAVAGRTENVSGPFADGVAGFGTGPSGYGVNGVNTDGGFGVFATGNMGATGTKSFVQPHPTDPAVELRFVCLEGNEAGTYFRGQTELVGGIAQLEIPEEFQHVTAPEGLTVQVTPRGPAMLWVESASLERIVVRGSSDVAFDYFVNGVRRGYADVELVGENRAYRPAEVGLPFGEGLPAEIRQMLVDNGTLNPDFTPNEQTALRLGWKLDPAGTAAAARERRLGLHREEPIEVLGPEPVEPERRR